MWYVTWDVGVTGRNFQTLERSRGTRFRAGHSANDRGTFRFVHRPKINVVDAKKEVRFFRPFFLSDQKK